LAEIQVNPDQIVLSLPRSQAYMSRLVLPMTARGSLAQVVDYELERLLPLSREEVYYDFLAYERGEEEGRMGVVIFGLPRVLVNQYLEDLAQVGLRPQAVTLSCSALVNCLFFCGAGISGPGALVTPSNGELEVSFVDKGHLVASHLLSLDQVRTQEEVVETLTRGLARDLPGLSLADAEVYHWAATNGGPTFALEVGRDLYRLAKERFAYRHNQNGEVLGAAAIPALGAALQAVSETGVGVNLLPVERRGQQEKRLSLLTLFLAGLILVLGLVWAGSVIVQGRRVLDRLSQQAAQLAPEVQQVMQQEEEARQLESKLRTLMSERYSRRVVPLLKELTELLPASVYLTLFRYKEGSVDLTGIATSSASDLVALLENSPCLRDVAPKAPFTKTPQGETFTLGAQVEQCG
jgi:Tfp pilus assembly protein PilN